MTNDYKPNDGNEDSQGMTRRDALRVGLYGFGAALLGGCRAAFRALDPSEVPAYQNLVKASLNGDSIESLVKKSVTAFTTKPAPARMNVPWPSHVAQLGPKGADLAGGLVTIQSMNDNVADMLQGYSLMFHQVASSLYGARDDVVKALSMNDEAKTKFVKEFVAALSDEQRDRLAKLHDARVKFESQLSTLPHYQALLTQVRDGSFKTENEALTASAKMVVSTFDQNAAELQAYNLAGHSLLITEGGWGDAARRNIALQDGLQLARGYNKFTDLGKRVLERKVTHDGKETVLQELLNTMGAKADKHFKDRDCNFLDDIFQDNRDPVVNAAFKQLYVPGTTSTNDHQGLVYVVDGRMCDASMTPVDSTMDVLNYIVRFLPGVTMIHSMVNDWPYLFTPNSPDGDLTQVLDKSLQAYFGATNLSWLAGDENPTGRALLALIITLAEAAAIAAMVKSGGNGHSNGGGTSTTPAPGQTTTGGIK
ncbi:hypothetical protein HY493_03265 [Candidatus Woesearchaeota archaeon]|nr:hypothetical protein [Candidatus Woesearchaeota archaeon]